MLVHDIRIQDESMDIVRTIITIIAIAIFIYVMLDFVTKYFLIKVAEGKI